MINLIVACSNNYGIGLDNKLIIKSKEDMKFFKTLTTGNIVIMGRKTFESMGLKPLPNRLNIVLTREKTIEWEADNLFFDNDLATAISKAEKIAGTREIYIIGGGEIYKQAIELGVVDHIYCNKFQENMEADTFFDKLDDEDFSKISDRFSEDNKFRYLQFVSSVFLTRVKLGQINLNGVNQTPIIKRLKEMNIFDSISNNDDYSENAYTIDNDRPYDNGPYNTGVTFDTGITFNNFPNDNKLIVNDTVSVIDKNKTPFIKVSLESFDKLFYIQSNLGPQDLKEIGIHNHEHVFNLFSRNNWNLLQLVSKTLKGKDQELMIEYIKNKLIEK